MNDGGVEMFLRNSAAGPPAAFRSRAKCFVVCCAAK